MSVIINGITYVPQICLRIEDISLGELLKRARKDCKLSLDKAAIAIGCSKSYLWDVEANKTEPSLRMARAISEAYGLPIATIAGTLK